MLRTLILAAVAAACLGLAPTPSRAAVYSFTYSDNTNSGDNYSGLLTVSGGLVTAISGTSALYGAITDLFPPNTAFNGPATDNVFGTTFPFLTANGVGFATEIFGVIFTATTGDDRALGDLIATTSQLTSSIGNFSVTLVPGPVQVPEPGALAILLAGLAGIGLVRSRDRAA
jgi:hypothetical protein